MDLELARWACGQLRVDTRNFGPPPRLQRNAAGKSELVTTLPVTAWRVPPAAFADASFELVRAQLLDDERFGKRSEDDWGSFDPTAEGSAGVAERDAALRAFLAQLSGPARLSVVVDRARDGVLLGVCVLSAPGALGLFSCVALAVQLDTRAYGEFFR